MSDFSRALRQLHPQKQPQRHLFSIENPVSSLARQLQFLKTGLGGRSGDSLKQPGIVPSGTEEVTPHGRHYVIRKVYDGLHFHGKVRLSRFSCGDLRLLMSVMREKGEVPVRDRIVFLDTETTGMQGGAGVCPFLVGLGYFEDDDFHMVQFFIRDFDEEPSMLYALGRLMDRFQLVVTYNGASFDIPLLESRFTLARIDSPFGERMHLDLLTTARRLWRNGHGSCRLVALEDKIVSFLRGPDVPGALIPRAYFDFLHGRPNSVLGGVFLHNVHDVVSLAALTVCACDRVTADPRALDEPLDLYSLARVLENSGEWTRSAALYDLALAGGLPENVRQKAMESLAVICRRAGAHERALSICEELMDGDTFSMTAHEGAAIHYERLAGDPGRALAIVDRALARLPDDMHSRRWRISLQNRRERLRQKAIQF